MPATFDRAATPVLTDLLDHNPAVLLHGPRSAGKRTIASFAAAGFDYEFIDLEDDATRLAVASDPARFVWDLPPLVVIQGVQYQPALIDLVAAEAVRDPAPGRFLLTTTVRPGVLPEGLTPFRIDPLSQEELGGWNSAFLECLFDGGLEPGPSERLGYELYERITDGGLAEAVLHATPAARADWYRDHVDRIVRRDVMEGSRLRDPRVLTSLIQSASAASGDLLNVASMAQAVGASRPTVYDYVERLSSVHLIDLVPAWLPESAARPVTAPRLHVIDTGIASAVQGVTAKSLAADRTRLPALLSTFVFQELRRQSVGRSFETTFSHFRDRDGATVECVIERDDGAVAGICVRTSGTITTRDFRGLRKLRRLAGDRFATGVVLYDGVSTVAFENDLVAAPIRLLWELE